MVGRRYDSYAGIRRSGEQGRVAGAVGMQSERGGAQCERGLASHIVTPVHVSGFAAGAGNWRIFWEAGREKGGRREVASREAASRNYFWRAVFEAVPLGFSIRRRLAGERPHARNR